VVDMKKILIILLTTLILTGCTVVRIDTNSIDSTIGVILSKNNDLFNVIGKGYKYYVPRGVSFVDTDEYNNKLYSDGNYYYLYIDIISYYHNKKVTYEENKKAYYSKAININGKEGYLEINKAKDLYLVEFMYNYAKIEVLVEKEDINNVVLNSSYILSTIKFNNNVIKLTLDDDYFTSKEEKYDIFTSKKDIDNFLMYSSDASGDLNDGTDAGQIEDQNL
jgi:hypothetical protein